jgi:hypothetical protein
VQIVLYVIGGLLFGLAGGVALLRGAAALALSMGFAWFGFAAALLGYAWPGLVAS